MTFARLRSSRFLVTAVMAGSSLLMLMGAPLVQAADKPLNLITSPLPVNLETDPGHTVSTDLRVKQNGGDTERLKVTLMKFGAFGDQGKPQLLDRQPGDDYFDWVKFDKTSFDAPNNVWQTVHMTINVPKTAAFGYYYAVVFSRAGDDKATAAGQPVEAINGGSAVLVLLDANVAGAKPALTLASFQSDHRFYEFLPVTFSTKFTNTGNIHVVPHGNIFITKGNKQIASIDLNDEQGNVLPASNRIYPNDWLDGFPHYEPVVSDGKVKTDAKGKTVNHLVWGNGGSGAKDFKPHLRFGRYTAHLFAVYDDGTRDVPLEAAVTFWVVPWRFLLVLLVIVALVSFGFYAGFRGAWRGTRRLKFKRRRR